MLAITILFALGAALLNALSSVMQRQVAGHPKPEELFRRHFITRLLLNKSWIFAFGLETLAFLFQAGALKNGSLVLVEPLLTVDLVFLLLILHFKYQMKSGRKEWLAVASICVGLSGLMLSANPQPGNRPFDAASWSIAVGLMLIIIGTAIFLVRRLKSSRWRAGVSGAAAALSFAMVAAFTKLTTIELHQGVLKTLVSWQLWSLFASGMLSIVMLQSTYGAGPLATSQPAMETTEPTISVLFGILLFGDVVNHQGLALAMEIAAGALVIIGIWMMGSSKRLYLS